MRIDMENIEREEVDKKRGNKKQYLYALGVIGIVGLLFAVSTGIPIGVQFVVPTLNSVTYFFDGGPCGHEMMVYYIVEEHKDAWDAFLETAFDMSLAWLLDYIGIDVITGISDVVLSSSELLAEYLATLFIEALPWWLGPVAVGYAAGFAAL